jgi:hypothetical protein
MNEWLVVGLESGVHWPTVETTVLFEGHEIILRPETDTLAPSVALSYAPPLEEAYRLVRRFLSSLAWVERGHLREIGASGGTHAIGIGKGPMARLIDPRFRADYLPAPADPRARPALALYREALGLESIPYQFLGFYKVVNILHERGPAQTTWINGIVDRLDDLLAPARVAEIRLQGHDVGVYLYESGRCAVAHAFDSPIVDPDDPQDTDRLARDLPLMKAVAEYAIEHELRVRSMRTIWREHLYELVGFRESLGVAIVDHLKNRQDVAVEAFPPLSNVSVRLRDHGPFAGLENLQPEVVSATAGKLALRCRSDDRILEMVLCLNFAAERLEFDPERGAGIRDDGSVAAAEKALGLLGFIRGLYSNGELEVWESDRQALLGRCDAYIPLNIDLQATDQAFEMMAVKVRAEIERRRQADGMKG